MPPWTDPLWLAEAHGYGVPETIQHDDFHDGQVAAYLGPFARAGSDLVAAAVLASRLGWVCRAVNGHVPGDLDGTRVRLRMFVDGHP